MRSGTATASPLRGPAPTYSNDDSLHRHPHDLDAERALLGGILRCAKHLDVQEVVALDPMAFYHEGHAKLFEALRVLQREDRPLDIITLKDAIGDTGIERCGGAFYIDGLTDGIPRSVNVRSYASIIAKHAWRREYLALVRLLEHRLMQGADDGGSSLLNDLQAFADEQRPPCRFRVLDDEAIAALPDTPFIVDGLIPDESFGTLWAKTGVGKTTLLMRILVHISSGKTLLGATIRRPGNVALVVTEGRGALRVRHDAAWAALDVPVDQRAGIHAIAEPIDLLQPEDVDALIASLRPVSPVLLAIDGWARTLSEPDGDTGATVRAVKAVDRIREALGCTVLVAHHPGWDDSRERGSYHLRASVDFLWSLKADGDEGRLILECEKSRDSEPFPPIRLSRMKIRDSVTIELAADQTSSQLSRKHAPVLDALTDGATKCEWVKACDQAASTVYRHIQDLTRTGHVEIRDGYYFGRVKK